MAGVELLDMFPHRDLEEGATASSDWNPTDAVLFFGLSLVLGIACRHLLRGTRVPYTVALLVLGIVLGSIGSWLFYSHIFYLLPHFLLTSSFIVAILVISSFSVSVISGILIVSLFYSRFWSWPFYMFYSSPLILWFKLLCFLIRTWAPNSTSLKMKQWGILPGKKWNTFDPLERE